MQILKYILGFLMNALANLFIIAINGTILGLIGWGSVHWFASLLFVPTVPILTCILWGMLICAVIVVIVETVKQVIG